MRQILLVTAALCPFLAAPTAQSQISISHDDDIGVVAAAGYATYGGSTVAISGSGADIWKSADEFHYSYAMLSGDCEITARALSLSNTDPWAKAGPMIRESLSPASRFAMMIVTPGVQGAAFQYRLSTGGSAAPSNSGDLISMMPRWLRLVRQGNTVSGYQSSDGVAWALRSRVTIALPATILIGLAVTSHSDGVVAEATFDNVSIVGASPDVEPPAAPANLSARTSGSSRIQVGWSAAVDSGGGSVGSYRVYRDFGVAPVSMPTGTTYLDTGLVPDTDYRYEVTAVDSAGNESGRSVYVIGRTSAAPPPGEAPDWLWTIAPGTWRAIGENTMESVNSEKDPVVNARYPRNSLWHGSVGLPGVIGAWNGGAFASRFGSHGALLLYGGGRNNYLGSDVYAFDLGMQRWSRVTDPYPGPFSWPYPSTTYPDGSPVPPHTYNYVQYHSPSNSFVLLRGITDGKAVTNDTSIAIAHFLSLDSRQWRTGAVNDGKYQKSGGISCYDENRDLFWVIAPTDRSFTSFDPNVENADGTFGRYTNYPSPEISLDGAADCDPERDLFVYTLFSSNKRVMARDLRSPERPAVQLREGGVPPEIKENKNGWAWSRRRGAFIYWRRGGDVYEFRLVDGAWDTGTWQWSKLTDPTNTVVPQPMLTDNGVYGRFRIARFADDEVALVVSQTTGAVYAFRIP